MSYSRTRTVVTWALWGIWVFLITFGIVSLSNPAWLEKIGTRGRQSEAFAGRTMGDNALKRRDFALAIAEYRRALEIRPDAADIQLNLGIAYVRSGDTKRGEAALRKVLEMDPTPRMLPVVALYLGEVAERENRKDEAIQYYRQALTQGIRPDLANHRLGALYLAADDLPRAREAFEKTLEAQTDPRLLYHDMVDRARELAETDTLARRWLESAGSRELTEADWARFDSETIRRVQETDHEIAKTHNYLGLICYRQGDRDAAIQHFERSLAIWPGNTDAARNLPLLRSAKPS